MSDDNRFEHGDWVQHLFTREKGIVLEVSKLSRQQVVLVQWAKRTQQNWVNMDILIAIKPPVDDPN